MGKKWFSVIVGMMLVFGVYGPLLPHGLSAVKEVSAIESGWVEVTTPSQIGEQLQAGTDVSQFVVAPDGLTMFAYDNIGKKLYRSHDAGVTWTTTNIGIGLNGYAVTAMAISPSYTTDSTMVACSGTGDTGFPRVWRSVNGGQTWGEVGTMVGGLIAAGSSITSIDIANYYAGGQAILIGDGDVAGLTGSGGVSLYTTNSLTWVDLMVTSPCDVLAVAFSPNHQTGPDAEILALCVDATDTYLRTKFGSNPWDVNVIGGRITGHRPTYGVIEFPADYNYSSNNKVFVGTAFDANWATALADVYVVSGGLPGGSTTVKDLNVCGSGASDRCNVRSIACKGNFIGGKVLVGQWASGTIKRTSDPSASTVVWSSSTKSPSGGYSAVDYRTIAWSPTSNTAYAATTGAGSAFCKSIDDGNTWNGIALIEVSALANISIIDFATVDASTMFLLMYDDADASGTVTPNDYTMLFKSTNGGANWENVWWFRTTASLERMLFVAVSPAYATDSTVYVVQNDTRIWKSTSGGQSWIGMTAPAAITAFYVVDASTYYTGSATGFHKIGRWTSPTLPAVVKSIAIAPDGTIFIGTNDGDVLMSTDDGLTFSCLGASEQLGNGADVLVAIHPDYATNKMIYAGSSMAAKGVQRWKVGVNTAWTPLDDDTDTLSCSGVRLLGSPGSILYVASKTVNKGVRRGSNPADASPLFSSLTSGLPADSALLNLWVIGVSNVLFAIADLDAGNDSDESGTYGYETRLLTYTDTTVPINFNLKINVIGNGTTSPTAGVHTYVSGKEVNLTATPEPGWQFSGWSGAITNTSDTISITMNSNAEVTATFTQTSYTLTLLSTEGGTVTAPGKGTYSHTYGDVVDLVATAHKGYHFTGWSGNVTKISDSNASITTITIDSSFSVTANFAQVTGSEYAPGDVNRDGSINAVDITKVERIIAGLD